MNKIEVKILEHNLNGMAKFLARLTQKGHQITCMNDLMTLYDNTIDTSPNESLLKLPHTTLRRMNYMTIAIVGLSTKAVSQIRTHATRLTFLSTSTQYSSYEGREDNWVIPELPSWMEDKFRKTYGEIQILYNNLIEQGIDKDKISYILPQGLRKALIISGNLDAWQYVIQTRLCRRNTFEVQYIMRLIYKEIYKIDPVFTMNMMPTCDNCREGRFCCGHKLDEQEVLDVNKIYTL